MKNGKNNKRKQQIMTPDQVLQELIDGNKRFYSNNKNQQPALCSISQKTKRLEQFPKATILACMDSRSVPEIIFDQFIGDIFSLRVAGNIVNNEIVASLEYATQYADAKLIVIMGHTHCGAIESVCTGNLHGNLQALANAIDPAVKEVQKQHSDTPLDCKDEAFIKKISQQNVRNMISRVTQESEIIQELLEKETIKIVGALHDLESGVVTFE